MPPHPSTSSAHPPPPPPTIALSKATLLKLKPAKIFKNAVEAPPPPIPTMYQQRPPPPVVRSITGIGFDDRGDQLITAGEDEAFKVYNCKTGKLIKTFYSKKYGVDLPRFTHKNTAILHASTKEDDTIRYHSLHDNKYLQYFRGHKGKVLSLEVSPIDDGFLSTSMDKTVRLWDLRSPACRGLLTLPAYPIAAYDPSGIIFAVAVNQYSRILLYDTANFDKAPFTTITLHDPTLALISYPPRPIVMTSLSFSANGKQLLVGCSGNAHYVIDAFYGHLLGKLEGHVGLERKSLNAPQLIEPTKGISGEEVSWTPDGKFVVSGSLDGKIYMWDVQQLPEGTQAKPENTPMRLSPTITLDGHPGPSRCVKFNPRFAMMSSAGTEVAFWLPDRGRDAGEAAKDLLKKR